MPGLVILLLFFLAGSVLQNQLVLPIPAAIVGMLLLLTFLLLRGRTPAALQQITTTLSPLLPLFLIPVSSGIITQKDILGDYGVALLVILTVSLIPGILVCGWIMSSTSAGEKKR